MFGFARPPDRPQAASISESRIALQHLLRFLRRHHTVRRDFRLSDEALVLLSDFPDFLGRPRQEPFEPALPSCPSRSRLFDVLLLRFFFVTFAALLMMAAATRCCFDPQSLTCFDLAIEFGSCGWGFDSCWPVFESCASAPSAAIRSRRMIDFDSSLAFCCCLGLSCHSSLISCDF